MRGVHLLHPELQVIAARFAEDCAKAGLNVLITDTWRTKAEQDDCVKRGASKLAYPASAHNWGAAFDFCRNVKGREYDDSDGFFAKCGAVGKKLGLSWGGDFKTPDKPHLEYAKLVPGGSAASLQRQYATPELFKSTWPATFTATQQRPAVKQGAKGQDVKDLQAALNKHGASLAVDGSFGPLTDKAVREFQRKKALSVDGIVGPKTWAAIDN